MKTSLLDSRNDQYPLQYCVTIEVNVTFVLPSEVWKKYMIMSRLYSIMWMYENALHVSLDLNKSSRMSMDNQVRKLLFQ